MAAPPQTPEPRTLTERRSAAAELLRSNTSLWLATASDGRGVHLIPLAYVWDGDTVTMATFEQSRTVDNVRDNPVVRLAVGHPVDLLMIDGRAELLPAPDIDQLTADRYAQVSFDPRELPGLIYLRVTPARMQVWTGFHEFHGRTVMVDGRWLDRPVDELAERLPAWVAAWPE